MQPEEQHTHPRKYEYVPRTWRVKFTDAFLGLQQSICNQKSNQKSYRVHFIATLCVLLLGLWFHLDIVRWALLILCITIVLTGEIFNTSIETLAKAVTSDYNSHVKHSLNIASGAVLLLAFGAAVVGSLIFLEALFSSY